MAYPDYVLTRTVTLGGAMTLESAETLIVKAVLRASRSLIWDETGFRLESHPILITSAAGVGISVDLPRTDLTGWRDARTGQLIDVSTPNSATHSYILAVSFYTASGAAVQNYLVGPFIVPEGVGELDLDTLLPAETVSGELINIPDTWSQQIADALALVGLVSADPGNAAIQGTDGLIWVPIAGGGDHGNLAGLADDDHPQYLNTIRGDLRYAALIHLHTLDDTSDTVTRVAMTPAERSKLAGVANGATANAADAALRDRTTHTGMQLISTVTGLQAALDGKAALLGADDNYVTDAEKIKLSNLSGVNSGDQTLPTWSTLAGKPATFPPDAHTHDDRYYTEAQMDFFMGGFASTGHDHNGVYAPVLGVDDNYVTDAEKVKLANLSGTNSGDQDLSGLVTKATVDAKGDLLVGTAADAVGRLAAGTDNTTLLVPDSSQASGLKWAIAPLRVIVTTASTAITAASGDHGKLIQTTAATAVTIELPAGLPVGTQIEYQASAAGLSTFTLGAGASWSPAPTPSAVLRAQGSAVVALCVAANAWTLIGDLA